MSPLKLLAIATGALVCAFPAQALAGTVTRDANAITYQAASASAAAEQVEVGIANGMAFVTSTAV